MTEKRFNIHIDEVGIYYYVCDNSKKGDDRIILELNTKYDAMEVCELLNELHEENKRLKAYLVRYVSGVSYDDLDKICNDEILSEWWEDLE